MVRDDESGGKTHSKVHAATSSTLRVRRYEFDKAKSTWEPA
jgi:hypothetical protein